MSIYWVRGDQVVAEDSGEVIAFKADAPDRDPTQQLIKVSPQTTIDVDRAEIVTRDGLRFYTFSGMASTKAEDSYGDTIDPDGWDLAKFKRNSVLLHMHNPATLLGGVPEIEIQKGVGLYAQKCEILLTPLVEEHVVSYIKAGYLKGLSVGFKIKKYIVRDPKSPWGGWDIIEQELRELSVVTLPANTDCMIDNKMLSEHRAYVQRMMRGDAPVLPVAFGSVPWQPDAATAISPASFTTVIAPSAVDGVWEEAEPDIAPLGPVNVRAAADFSGLVVCEEADDWTVETAAETRQRGYLVGPREGEDAGQTKSWRLRVCGLSKRGSLVVDLTSVRKAMGMLFTRKHGLTDDEQAAAFDTVTELYEKVGLTVPARADGTPAQPGDTFCDVTFAQDEDWLVARATLASNVAATLSGLRHFAKRNQRADDADLADSLERLAAEALNVLPEERALTFLSTLLEPPADPGEGLTEEEAAAILEHLSGADPTEFLGALGIDPNAPDAAARIGELNEQIERALARSAR